MSRTSAALTAISLTVVLASGPAAAQSVEVEITKPYRLTTHCPQHFNASNGPANLTEALVDANSCDTMAVSAERYAPYAKEMLSANPRLRLMVYLNAGLCNEKRSPTGNNPCPGTYLKDRSGAYVRANVTRNWLMRPQSLAWADEVERECRLRLRQLGATGPRVGCYLDMLGLGALGGMMTGIPVVPGTTTNYTEVPWRDEIRWLTERLSLRLGADSIYLTGNGIHSGQFFERWTAPLLTYMPFSAENSWRNPPKLGGTLFARWSSNMSMFKQADKPITITAKGWGGEDLTWTLANQVLSDKAYSSPGQQGLGNPYSWTTTNVDGTEYHPLVAKLREGFLGEPAGAYTRFDDGTYRRKFVQKFRAADSTVRTVIQGWVYVNPADGLTVKVTLPFRAELLDGRRFASGSVVQIPPQQALIIRRV